MLTWGSPATECEGLTLRLQDEAPGITLFPRMCLSSADVCSLSVPQWRACPRGARGLAQVEYFPSPVLCYKHLGKPRTSSSNKEKGGDRSGSDLGPGLNVSFLDRGIPEARSARAEHGQPPNPVFFREI